MPVQKTLVNSRHRLGITQEAAARAANISRTHYVNIENGKRHPSPKTAQKIAVVLKIDWTLFFDGTGR